MNTSTRETWQRVDELEEVYARLADRRKATWLQWIGHQYAGAERQARRLGNELNLLDAHGLALAVRIDDLVREALQERSIPA